MIAAMTPTSSSSLHHHDSLSTSSSSSSSSSYDNHEAGACYRQHFRLEDRHEIPQVEGELGAPDIDNWGLASVFLTPAGLGFLYGFDLGATSFVVARLFSKHHHRHHHTSPGPHDVQHPQQQLQLSTDDDSTNQLVLQQRQLWWLADTFDHTSWRRGWFIATLSLGAWLGSHLVFLMTHPSNSSSSSSSSSGSSKRHHLRQHQQESNGGSNSTSMGRRHELQICASLYVLGACANVLSGTTLAYSSPLVGFAMLLLGRLLFGMGVGFIMHGAPAYMAEMCPDQVRGAVVTAKEAMIVSGILVGYAAGNCLLGGELLTTEPELAATTPEVYNDQAMMTIIVYWMNAAVQRWTVVYLIMLVATVPLLLLSLFVIPESHRWLLRQGRIQEASESFRFVYKKTTNTNINTTIDAGCNYDNDNDDDDLVTALWHRLVHGPDKASSSLANQDCRPSCHSIIDGDGDNDDDAEVLPTSMISFLSNLWRNHPSAYFAAMGLIVFQQFSGQPCILSYAPSIWSAAGWSGNASVVTAVIMLCTAMGTVVLVDVVGRKRLLKACCVVMATALLLLALCFWHEPQQQPQTSVHSHHIAGHSSLSPNSVPDNTADYSATTTATTILAISWTQLRHWLIVVGMFAYVAGYQLGFGPITWLVVSEVFPMNVRGPAIAAGVELNYLLNFFVQFALAAMQDMLGWGATFLSFAVVLVAAYWYIDAYVPETTGMSLEEIETEMAKYNNTHHHNGNNGKSNINIGGKKCLPTQMGNNRNDEESALLLDGKDVDRYQYMTLLSSLSTTWDHDDDVENDTWLCRESSNDSIGRI